MALDLAGIVRRIEWLEKWAKGIMATLADLRAQIGALRLNFAEGPTGGDQGTRLVILRPTGAVGVASFTEEDTGPPYVPARIVPANGTGYIWQEYDFDTGEMRARKYVNRWDPEAEPPGHLPTLAPVDFSNYDNLEGIPADAKYVVCVTLPSGRLRAIVWQCAE